MKTKETPYIIIVKHGHLSNIINYNLFTYVILIRRSSTSLNRSMDVKSVQCLADNIYRFNHLVSCLISKTMPAEKNYRSLVSFLKHLKPLLDNVADLKVHPNEFFTKECEELDAAIHEAMEFLDKWFPKMSKILFVSNI